MQNLFIKELGIKYLLECLNRYNAGTGYLLLFLCLIIFLFIKGNELEKKIFMPLGVIMAVTVFNPVFPVILSKFTDVSNEYYRFFWIAPVIVLVPYMMAKVIIYIIDNYKLLKDSPDENIKEKKIENVYAPVILMILVLLFASNSAYFKEFKIAENIYKIPDELINITEIIHEDSEDEYPKAFFDYEYNMMVRQYDPKMLLTIDREDYIYAAANDYTTDMIYDNEHPQYRILAYLFRYQPMENKTLLDGLDMTSTEYVVIPKGSTNIEKLLNMGLTQIAETETHTILKYELKDKKPFELVDYSEVYENGW